MFQEHCSCASKFSGDEENPDGNDKEQGKEEGGSGAWFSLLNWQNKCKECKNAGCDFLSCKRGHCMYHELSKMINMANFSLVCTYLAIIKDFGFEFIQYESVFYVGFKNDQIHQILVV